MFELLKGLSGRHVFITGGTGVVGKCLLDALIDLNRKLSTPCQVTVLSRDPQSFQSKYPRYQESPWLKYMVGDIMSLQPRADLNFTDVIHAAADTHSQQDKWMWIEQIVRGTRNVLEFAKSSGASRLINMSSGAVYGEQPANLASIPETYMGAPSTQSIGNVYGQAKRMAEQVCTVYRASEKLEISNVRLFAIASHHLPLDGPYAFASFVASAMRGEPIVIKGSGDVVRSYLDGDAMAQAMLGLLQVEKLPDVINIGSDKPVSLSHLAEVVAEIFDIKAGVQVLNQTQGKTDRNVYLPNVDLALSLNLLSLQPLAQIVLKIKGELT